MMSLKSSPIESFPLMSKSSSQEMNDWSDQEFDHLMQSPLEDMLEHIKYRRSARVSRSHCIRSILYFSMISFVLGASLSFLLSSTFYYPTVTSLHSFVPSLSQIHPKQVLPSLMPFHKNDININENIIREKLFHQIDGKHIEKYLQ